MAISPCRTQTLIMSVKLVTIIKELIPFRTQTLIMALKLVKIIKS